MPLLRDLRDELGSTYLLDHVDNPVRWRTWGADTLDEAARSDRPIFLSIGYAACHWCHVMAHESFEDQSIAQLLNEFFVPVKVDREERPDVDALYMAATQLVAGHGGWPMSVFLLPDGRPFMAGTYYPPTDRGGHVGFERLVRGLHDAWTNNRELVERQANELSLALERDVHFIDHLEPWHDTIDLTAVRERLRRDLLNQEDPEGGFGSAPKFPRPSYVEALLDADDVASRRVVEHTLEAMARRGLYDHFGGGFARYSVDDVWHVPHFEKMLSDQGLLARCYLRSSEVLRRPEWRAVALDTLRFVEGALRRDDGFASSLDADADGVEGSHVTWTVAEVANVLTNRHLEDQLPRALERWRIDDVGSFEGRSIPRLGDGEPFVTPPSLASVHEALITQRATRVQPSRDEKVILEWNAMVASAFLRSDDRHFETLGLALLRSLSRTHFADASWWRTERRQAYATASDVAWFADAVVDAFELTGDDEWLRSANDAVRYLIDHFWDGPVPNVHAAHKGAGLFSQSDHVVDLATRPKEIFDGATPSAHAIATRALARTALCRGDSQLLVVAQRLVELAGSILASHPIAVVDLVTAAGFALEGVQVVVPGVPGELAHHVRSLAMPSTVMITGSGTSPLLEGRHEEMAYVCRGGVCALPVSSAEALDEQLDEIRRSWRS